MADSEPSLVALALGNAAYAFSKMQPLLPVYLHMILASLFPIYAAAHASLTRPSTAAKRAKKARRRIHEAEDEDEDTDSEDEDEEPVHEMEGLTNRHIILFPLFAGIALATLYFLIKWLEDATILNRALNAYFAIFGLAAVTTLVSDVLDFGHSIIFPRRHVLGGALYHVDAAAAKARPVAGNTRSSLALTTPLPGFLARVPLPTSAKQWLWTDRAMPSQKWTLKLYTHGALAGKLRIGGHNVVGIATALATILYFNLVDKPWYLTNLLGYSFAYGSMQMISPTTFVTGSGILAGLFFYDIYMVFFTPLMVTVATSLDVPIKLMFPKPGSFTTSATGKNTAAMLGLGDIVIPGLMVGLALRFDLYLFYLRRQKCVPATTEKGSEEEAVVVKAEYYPLAGHWTDCFWTHSLMGTPLWRSTSPNAAASNTDQGEREKEEAPFTFPKVYFNAALVGYIAGLVATLCALHVMNHAQPALLWLVPGVLLSLWSTALARGEVGLMWNYSEEIVGDEEEGTKQPNEKTTTNPPQNKPRTSRRPDREVLSFSIHAPRECRQMASTRNDNVNVEREGSSTATPPVIVPVRHQHPPNGTPTFWTGSTASTTATAMQDSRVDVEPAGKRLRVR